MRSLTSIEVCCIRASEGEKLQRKCDGCYGFGWSVTSYKRYLKAFIVLIVAVLSVVVFVPKVRKHDW